MEQDPKGSSTVAKAVDILFHLRDAQAARGVSEMARALGLQKSGVHRLLRTLTRRDLVERRPDGTYALGLGLASLGAAAASANSLAHVAGDVLDELAATTGETVFLVAQRGSELTVLALAEGRGFLRAAPRVGEAVPPNKTAVGKLYAVHAPRGIGALPRLSTTAKNRILQAGYAVNLEEWQPGLSVVAVPLFVANAFVGALTLATVSQRMELLSIEKVASRLKHAAASIQNRFQAETSSK